MTPGNMPRRQGSRPGEVTWENLRGRPAFGKYAVATNISYNELTELPDLSSLGSTKAVPRTGSRGGPEWLSNREDVDEVRARHQEGFA